MINYLHVLSKIKTVTTAFVIALALVLPSLFYGTGSASAAAGAQAYDYKIRSGASNGRFDASGKAILRAEDRNGRSVRTLDASIAGRTVELPVGTILFLRFPGASPQVKVSDSNVVRPPKARYHLPNGVVGVLEVVKEGDATITVTGKAAKQTITNEASASGNWSGYARDGANGSFTSVSSYWNVPTLSCTGTPTHSGAWIGIDGSTNTSLIQTGTASGCDSQGSPYHYAWWEILPASETIMSCAVNAGDRMYAEINRVATATFKIVLLNKTSGVDCSPSNQTYDGPLSSAEWIVERPTFHDENGEPALATLSNYGTVTFTNNTVNGSLANHDYVNEGRIMVDDTTTQMPLSLPSTPSELKDAFSTYYCDPVSGCPEANPPASWANNSPAATNEYLASVDAGQSEIWAVGWQKASYRLPIAYRYNYGSGAWGRLALPSSAYTHFELNSVAVSPNGDAWAVGSYNAGSSSGILAYRWANGTWTRVVSDNGPGASSSNKLRAVDVDASGTAWGVGRYITPTSESPLLVKWDGAKFAYQSLSLPSGYSSGSLTALSFDKNSNTGWAVGTAVNQVTRKQQPLLYRYDGVAWNPSTFPLSDTGIWKVSANSQGDAWAIGSTPMTQYTQRPLILHYVNGNWIEDTTPITYPSSTLNWNTVRDIEAVSPQDVWISGTYGDGTTTKPFIMHYNGQDWSRISTPSVPQAGQIVDISFAMGALWGVGSTGVDVGSYPTNPAPYALRSN